MIVRESRPQVYDRRHIGYRGRHWTCRRLVEEPGAADIVHGEADELASNCANFDSRCAKVMNSEVQTGVRWAGWLSRRELLNRPSTVQVDEMGAMRLQRLQQRRTFVRGRRSGGLQDEVPARDLVVVLLQVFALDADRLHRTNHAVKRAAVGTLGVDSFQGGLAAPHLRVSVRPRGVEGRDRAGRRRRGRQ